MSHSQDWLDVILRVGNTLGKDMQAFRARVCGDRVVGGCLSAPSKCCRVMGKVVIGVVRVS